jgi:branched-chain amino acid transport system permease protein
MSDSTAPAALAPWRRTLATTLRGGPLARAIPIAGAAALLLFPILSDNPYWIRELSLIGVWALVISGLNLTFGHAGELQFGQVFAFALGCYLTMILSIYTWDDLLALLVIGGVAAALAGAAFTLPALRIGGWTLAITSLFLVATVPDLVAIAPGTTGGFSGLVDIPYPHLFGHPLGPKGLCEVTMVVAVVWFAAYRNLVNSRYGIALRIMRQSPVLASSVGLSPLKLKVTAYALGAFPAGAAGCLFGFISLVIEPSQFDLTLTIGVVAAALLGGVQSVYGAMIGAAILQLGPQSSLSFHQYAPIAYGAFLIFAAIAFRGGLSGFGRHVAERGARALGGPPQSSVDQQSAITGPPLEPVDRVVLNVSSISKAFGGAGALHDVSLTAMPGEITGLIGANGSGKTTLLNVICGFVRPDRAGTVTLGAVDITRLSAHAIARAGVARTFQTPNVPRGMSALDVVASGRFTLDRQGLASSILRLPGYRRSCRADRVRSLEMLDLIGIADVANRDASTLSLGTRRLLEVARALCGRPRLLLLDEPASGLSSAERDQLAQVLRAAAEAGSAVVLIEHNVGFVIDTADTTHVLDCGKLVASGPAAAISADQAVVESFVGGVGHAPGSYSHRRLTHAEAALEVRAAESGYRDLTVLRNVSLSVRRGSIEAVLGRNGVGKTTLLATIAGQVQLRGGTITIDGKEVGRLAAHRRAAAGIAFVPEGKRIFRERTVAENIALGTFTQSLSRGERARLCTKVLEQFPALKARAGDRAGDLSGGQQQMLAIGQALAARPRILLLDEPSSGLAPSLVADVFQSLRLLSDDGMTVLLVEQLAPEALAIADHVTVLDGGTVISSGLPEGYRDLRDLQEAYLGVGWADAERGTRTPLP